MGGGVNIWYLVLTGTAWLPATARQNEIVGMNFMLNDEGGSMPGRRSSEKILYMY